MDHLLVLRGPVKDHSFQSPNLFNMALSMVENIGFKRHICRVKDDKVAENSKLCS